MNKLFYRTKSFNGFLVSDADLEIETAFYPPSFDEVTPLDIGNNDPNKIGAIATKLIDGETILHIYQGSDVWIPVGAFTPIPPEIIPFTSIIGGYSIDFTLNNRNALYNNPTIYAYIVDGDMETKIQGLGETINRTAGVIQSVDLDGIFGTGYILIKQ